MPNTVVYYYPFLDGLSASCAITHFIELPVKKKCGGHGYLADPCCGFNFQRCNNGMRYLQPVWVKPLQPPTLPCPPPVCRELPEDDLLYFQFQMPDNFNTPGNYTHVWKQQPVGDWFATLRAFCFSENCSEQYYISYDWNTAVVDSFVGHYEDGRTVQQIVINPKAFTCDFYLLFEFNAPPCNTLFYTEPYRRIEAECELNKTITIEGIFEKGSDCEGELYGLPEYASSTPFQHRNVRRVLGSFELENFIISQTVIKGFQGNRTTVSDSNKVDGYRLRTHPIPQYSAIDIARNFTGKRLLINDNEYVFSGDLAKNNVYGLVWLLDVSIKTLPCNIIHNCS